MEKLQVNVIKYSEFDALVKKSLGIEIEVVPDQEWSNYSDHLFRNIRDNLEIDEYEKKDFDALVRGECMYHYSVYTLLNEMCRRGDIEKGHYLITVFW